MTTSVNLRVYDISGGAAKRWSSILLGRQIQGVWHSGIEVFGFEYFYGGGIVKMKPENVEMTFGISPCYIHRLGETHMSRVEFERFLVSVMPKFRRELYNLTEWNCNHFTNYCTHELLDKDIPSYILDLPEEVGSTFMGKLLLNFLKMISGGGGNGGAAPISVDHHSGVKKEEIQRTRRHSCPQIKNAIPPPPVQNVTLPKLMLSKSAAEAAPPLQRIPGSPLVGQKGEEIPTELVISPVHKHLYEVEKNLYAPPNKKKNRRASVCV